MLLIYVPRSRGFPERSFVTVSCDDVTNTMEGIDISRGVRTLLS